MGRVTTFLENFAKLIGALTLVALALTKAVGVMAMPLPPNHPLAALSRAIGEAWNWLVGDPFVQPKPPTAQPGTQPPSANPAASTVFYVYYEEKNGKTTPQDGQLAPIGGGTLPKYSALKAGMVLKAVSDVATRTSPTGRSQRMGEVMGGRCVEITQVNNELTGLVDATSGGYLGAKPVACPS